jgi:hypothetical protein
MAAAAALLWRARGAWWRRSTLTPAVRARLLLVALGAVGWLWWIGVSVETQMGFSGNDRYLVLGTALIAISGGIGWGWVAAALAGLLRRLELGRRIRSLAAPSTAAVLGTGVALAVGIAFPPWIGPSLIDVPATHRALVYQAHLRSDVQTAIRQLGGSERVLACGNVMTEGFQVPMVAWTLGVHTLTVEAPAAAGEPPGPAPNVIFQTRDTRSAALLPLVHTWPSTPYKFVGQFRTFRVFEHCVGKVSS